MKLAPFVFAVVVGLAGAARADDLNPPGGPVHGDPAPVLVDAPQQRAAMTQQQRRAQHEELRRMLLERFDRNGDGRLEPNERRQAIRALRQLARQLSVQQRRAVRQARQMRRVMRRYDQNGDGVVDQNEIPPNVARKLRRLDRNRDGWVDDTDLP
jgi:hypothetical protein